MQQYLQVLLENDARKLFPIDAVTVEEVPGNTGSCLVNDETVRHSYDSVINAILAAVGQATRGDGKIIHISGAGV